MSERKGDWIQTFSGGQFWPIDPRPEEIRIVDIAHALSNVCRFTGHVSEFYSVAQHSVHVMQLLDSDAPLWLKRWALLHDASEAYIADLSRPVKRSGAIGEEYLKVEAVIMAAVCQRFDLPVEMPSAVHRADNIMLATEKRDLMDDSQALGKALHKWNELEGPAGFVIMALLPHQAKKMFMRAVEELGIR